jgi:hypothetical protein
MKHFLLRRLVQHLSICKVLDQRRLFLRGGEGNGDSEGEFTDSQEPEEKKPETDGELRKNQDALAALDIDLINGDQAI